MVRWPVGVDLREHWCEVGVELRSTCLKGGSQELLRSTVRTLDAHHPFLLISRRLVLNMNVFTLHPQEALEFLLLRGFSELFGDRSHKLVGSNDSGDVSLHTVRLCPLCSVM